MVIEPGVGMLGTILVMVTPMFFQALLPFLPGIGSLVASLFAGGPEESDFPSLERQADQESELMQMRIDLIRDLLGEGRQQRTDLQENLSSLLEELGGGFSFQNALEGAEGVLDIPFNFADQFQNAMGNRSLLPDQQFFDRLAGIAGMTNVQPFAGGQLANLLERSSQSRAGALGDAGGSLLQALLSSGFLERLMGDNSFTTGSGQSLSNLFEDDPFDTNFIIGPPGGF